MQAGVSYLDMVKEVGIGGIFIIVSLCTFQIGSLLDWSLTGKIVVTLAITGVAGFCGAQLEEGRCSSCCSSL